MIRAKRHDTLSAAITSTAIAAVVLVSALTHTTVVWSDDGPPPVDPSAAIRAYGEEISRLVTDTYAKQGERTLWLGAPTRVTENAKLVVKALAAADEQALDPRDYRVDEIQKGLSRLETEADISQDEISALDAQITTAVVMYVHDVAQGRLDPHRLGIVGGEAAPPRVDVPAFVDGLAHEGHIDEALASLPPRHAEYERLRIARAHYRALAQRGPWPHVPEGPVMHPGEPHLIARIDALAHRLLAEDLIEQHAAPKRAAGSTELVYGDTLVAGVKRFQSLRGLAADGVVGARTLAEINRPCAQIVRTIELNMERWRWVPDDLGAAHVRVNVPAFELSVYEGDQVQFHMPIIVGQVTWGTPLFSDRIRVVILNPYWNVPRSIARKEVLAKVFADRSYLGREGMEIVSGSGAESHVISPQEVNWTDLTPQTFPYRLRQKPGPQNPLGRIKFLFPNAFNVYLHDTPSGRLFALPERALSHGCIRIARPYDLAAWLFRDDPKWSGDRVQQAVEAGAADAIRVSRPAPLHIFYFTAVAGDQGKLGIYRDLYDIDANLDRSLRELSSKTLTLVLR